MNASRMKQWKALTCLICASTLAFMAIHYGLNEQGCILGDNRLVIDSNPDRISIVEQQAPKEYQLYHNWKLFQLDYSQMVKSFKVYVYPDAFDRSKAFSSIFLPHHNPYDRKLGNYFSEHMFKINLLNSSFLTRDPNEAHLFFMPFSVNVLRNDRRVHSEASIAEFVANYVERIRKEATFWNRTGGADHFYVGCHSVGRDAASKSPDLQHNAIQVTCSANYYQRFYVPHKDVSLPQVWPRSSKIHITPPENRTRLAFFSGRPQNSRVRQLLVKLWSNDSDIDIHTGDVQGSYEDAFLNSKFCLHVKGYEVNTARISDAIHFGCVPVIISNQYDLPMSNVINWRSFAVILSHTELPSLKAILQNISQDDYARLHANVCQVKKHFGWDFSSRKYDSFHMTMYQLWLRSRFVRSPLSSHQHGSSK